MTAAQSAQALQEKFPAAFVSVSEFRGETTVVVKLEHLVPVMAWLRDELAFDMQEWKHQQPPTFPPTDGADCDTRR